MAIGGEEGSLFEEVVVGEEEEAKGAITLIVYRRKVAGGVKDRTLDKKEMPIQNTMIIVGDSITVGAIITIGAIIVIGVIIVVIKALEMTEILVIIEVIVMIEVKTTGLIITGTVIVGAIVTVKVDSLDKEMIVSGETMIRVATIGGEIIDLMIKRVVIAGKMTINLVTEAMITREIVSGEVVMEIGSKAVLKVTWLALNRNLSKYLYTHNIAYLT